MILRLGRFLLGPVVVVAASAAVVDTDVYVAEQSAVHPSYPHVHLLNYSSEHELALRSCLVPQR